MVFLLKIPLPNGFNIELKMFYSLFQGLEATKMTRMASYSYHVYTWVAFRSNDSKIYGFERICCFFGQFVQKRLENMLCFVLSIQFDNFMTQDH